MNITFYINIYLCLCWW